ncbi:hypothetical protein [Sulfitobacter sp. JB4-11]|uniref:hypothetical protein n=1 Tax=Sulfitobacter rhodophyticola TaxID=3238304 RepID=UPI003513A59A
MTIRMDINAILDLWEAGQGLFPYQRAVLVLERCGWTNPADLSLAERDRALLGIHRASFNSSLDLITECPTCDSRLELTLDIADVEASMALLPSAVPAALKGIALRDVTTRDIDAVANAPDPASALRTRLAGPDALPAQTQAKLAGWIDARLSDAEVSVRLSCVECGHDWPETLDIPEYIWTEIEHRAHRALRDVADLARYYAWSEAAILALGPLRRQAYLNLARAS